MTHEVLEHSRDGARMVFIPAGPFLMGLPDRDFLAEDHEKPQREVVLDAFWIDIYPVTNGQYLQFLESGGYKNPAWWTKEGWDWRQREQIEQPTMWGVAGWDGHQQPVAGVSWFEAAAYAAWAGRRLPTDAEWEKAARGTDGRRYPWGNDWPTSRIANFSGSIGRTTPVGLYPDGVSPYGCHDMSGNVNNWVIDWYWAAFGRLCVERGLLNNPCLHDAMRAEIRASGGLIGAEISEKVDRGGGYATPREHQEVLGCTRKVFWSPIARESWNGFRTAMAIG